MTRSSNGGVVNVYYKNGFNFYNQTVTSVLSSGPNKGKRRSHSGRKTDSSLVSVIVDVVQNSDTPQYIRNNLLQITALHNSKVSTGFLFDVMFLVLSWINCGYGLMLVL